MTESSSASIDQKIVRVMATTLFRIDLDDRPDLTSVADRKAEWKESKNSYVMKARKLYRRFQHDGLLISIADEPS